MRHLLIVLSLCAALTLTGCGDDADSPAATAPVTVSKAPARDSVAELTAQVRKTMRTNFGIEGIEADWWHDVKKITIHNGLIGTYIYVDTPYYDDGDADEYARSMCMSFTSILPLPQFRDRIDGTRVEGANGEDITTCGPGRPPQ
jgi:hypothetical protein